MAKAVALNEAPHCLPSDQGMWFEDCPSDASNDSALDDLLPSEIVADL